MKQSLKFVVGFLLVSLVINNCQRSGSEADYGNKYLLTETSSGIHLDTAWVKLADHLGAIDKDMGLASVDVAEFSNNSKYVVSGASKGFDLVVWDVKAGEAVWSYKCKDQIEIACFSPDDEYLIVGGKFNKMMILNVNDWSLYELRNIGTSIESIKFSHDANWFAVGQGNGEISIYSYPQFEKIKTVIHTPKDKMYEIRNEPRADINSVDYSSNDKYLISGGMDGKIKIWDTENMDLIRTLPGHNASIKSVAISPQGTCIASASTSQQGRPENSIKIWDFETGDLIHTLTFPLGMEAVEFTPDGKYLAGGGREGFNQKDHIEEQGHIYFYSIPEDPVNQPIMQVHKEPVFRSEYLRFNKEGSKLVSGHEDGTVRLWDVIYN